MAWTVQALIDGGMEITAYCEDPDCRHTQPVDLVRFRDRFGPDAPMMRRDVLPRLRCSKCGGKNIDIKLSPGQTLVPGGAHGGNVPS